MLSFLTNTGDLRGHIYEQEASLRVSDLIQRYNDCDDNDCNFDPFDNYQSMMILTIVNTEFYHLLINDTEFDTNADQKWLLQATLGLTSCVRAMMW